MPQNKDPYADFVSKAKTQMWSGPIAGGLNHHNSKPRVLGAGYRLGAKDPADDGPEVDVIRCELNRSDWYYRTRLALPKFVAWCRKVGIL